MLHVMLLAIAALALGSSLFWLSRRGLRSKRTFIRGREELHRHGRTVFNPPLLRRLFGLGPLALDAKGIVVHRRRSMDHYAWADIAEPFTLKQGKAMSRVIFLHRCRNANYRKRRLFGNTRDEFITLRRSITSAYGMGWQDFLELLNESKARIAATAVASVSCTPLVSVADRPAELQAKSQSPSSRPEEQSFPGWGIKVGLAVAIAATFGFMLSSFSWMSGTAAAGDEPSYAYEGGGGGSGGDPPFVPDPSNINPQQHVVRGHYNAKGTYIAPHVATNPDGDRTNNLSSRGNTNLYTGTRGHK